MSESNIKVFKTEKMIIVKYVQRKNKKIIVTYFHTSEFFIDQLSCILEMQGVIINNLTALMIYVPRENR